MKPIRINRLDVRKLAGTSMSMAYELFIGDESYSSWSLRGWLMFDRFGIAVTVHHVGLYSGTMAEVLASLSPARLVPVMRMPDGTVVGDTLAMAETLAEQQNEVALWPRDAGARALARWMVAEMHSGFADLRNDCPMNLRNGWAGVVPSEGVLADVNRIDMLWAKARAQFGVDGSPWLFGDYSLADAFYAPVAARIAGYGLPVSQDARAYVDAHLVDLSFRRWRARGQARRYSEKPYQMPLDPLPWPGPVARKVHAVDTGPAENANCPYSGKPVTHFLETDGRIIGFCNSFCRDKTVADPEAWPAFTALL